MPQLVWLITGCSSGFGEQFVHEILSRGDLVIATARKLEKIRHLEQTGVPVLPLDNTSDQDTLNHAISRAIAIYGRVDVLVNNAAYAVLGSWEDVEYDQLVAQFETNVFGVVKVTKAILPHFRQKKAGTMVFIGSRAGWYGDMFAGPYVGSKFAIEGRSFHPRISDYAVSSEKFVQRINAQDQAQLGDTEKGVRIIVDLVRQEGCAATREVPFRFPLGTDCYETVKDKCEETLALLKDWESVMTSTDYEEYEPFYKND